MSWSETSPSNNWRRFAALWLALPAAGCFQPLYGEAAHPGLVAEMRAIAVAPIKDRIGHYLGNDLMTDFNGSGETVEPKYRLTVTVNIGVATPTVTSQINVANAGTVTANATYRLEPAGGGAAIAAGTAVAVTVYDRGVDRFANLRARRDSEIKLAKSLADEIELRIAAQLGEPK